MNYSAWKTWYAEIARALHLSEAEDQAATSTLALLLKQSSTIDDLEKLLRRRATVVLGAGPSLEGDIELMMKADILPKVVVICADGATSAFMKIAGRCPDITVSDLDGNMEDIRYANRAGTMVLVHAHGDNVAAVKKYLPLLRLPLLGTTQVRDALNVYNFGGFTDGDRAAFAAEANGAATIILAGMDFGSRIGPYSKPHLYAPAPASLRKCLKLNFARRLLEWLADQGDVDIVNCTGGGEDLRGIPRVRWKDLWRVIR